ncbi:MAG TPA: ABC transporter substrate-binding protein, partial [Alphaproteobacteria bacterium]|nr:ABC transporter substrate-binding protein [Alphaproteobacteria bacterium]
PYTATSFDPGEVKYVAFEGAWRPAKVKHLQTFELAEAATRVSSILSGEIDISQNVPMDAIAQLEAGGARVDIATRPSVMGWRFMSVRENSPFHDKRVRQAANYAINRQAIADELLGGITVPGGQCATRFTFGYNPDVEPYPYDPAKARALLAEAGYADGFDTEAMVLPGAFPADAEIYQFAAQQLNAVGIRVDLTNIQFAQWLDFWFAKTKGPEGGMGFSDIFQNSCHNYNAIPFDAYPNLSCQKPDPSHCDDDEAALLTQAFGEFDVEKRRKLIQELMALGHENAPNLFFVELVDMTGLSSRVENFTNTIQRFSFDTITLKQ